MLSSVLFLQLNTYTHTQIHTQQNPHIHIHTHTCAYYKVVPAPSSVNLMRNAMEVIKGKSYLTMC